MSVVTNEAVHKSGEDMGEISRFFLFSWNKMEQWLDLDDMYIYTLGLVHQAGYLIPP